MRKSLFIPTLQVHSEETDEKLSKSANKIAGPVFFTKGELKPTNRPDSARIIKKAVPRIKYNHQRSSSEANEQSVPKAMRKSLFVPKLQVLTAQGEIQTSKSANKADDMKFFTEKPTVEMENRRAPKDLKITTKIRSKQIRHSFCPGMLPNRMYIYIYIIYIGE